MFEQNHIDSEFNGGYSAIDAELISLRPNSGQTLLNAHQLQQQQATPASTVKSAATTKNNLNAKKSVMLNLKSGAINSTVEEFGNLSTRFSDTFTQNGGRCRLWLLIAALSILCLCFFVFGLSVMHLLDAHTCGGKVTLFYFLFFNFCSFFESG